jgi:peptidyl-dipeptidase Dcp
MPSVPSFLRAAGLSTALALISSLQAADAALPASNPFSQPSTLPFQYPQFDQIKDEHYAPAFAAGRAEQLQEVDAIARNPE